MTRSIHANAEDIANFEAHMAAKRRERDDNEGLTLKREEDSTPNSTVMDVFPCLNANPADTRLLPVYLDANFPNAIMQFGEPENDSFVSKVSCLVNSGAGCLTAKLRFIEGLIGMNPAVIVEFYTCKNGEYAPIVMHGILWI